jgi:hypothetical protein
MITETASRVRHALASAVELVERLAAEELIAVRAAPAVVATPALPRRRPEPNCCDATPWRPLTCCERARAAAGAR